MRMNVSLEGSRPVLTLVRDFAGPSGEAAGMVEVRVDFNSLMKHILEIGRWKGSYACLVNEDGTYLAHTDKSMRGAAKLGESGDTLTKRVLSEMKTTHFGTVFGKGHPPDWVVGFIGCRPNWYSYCFQKGCRDGSARSLPVDLHYRRACSLMVSVS
jgi:hypothetical protein